MYAWIAACDRCMYVFTYKHTYMDDCVYVVTYKQKSKASSAMDMYVYVTQCLYNVSTCIYIHLLFVTETDNYNQHTKKETKKQKYSNAPDATQVQ